MFKLPGNNWRPDYSSDKRGNLIATQNLDFDNEGYLSLAPKPVNIYNQDDDAGFTRVFGIQYFNTNGAGTDGYLVLTRGGAYNVVLADGGAVTEIASDSTFANTFPDLVIFNGLAHFSGHTGTTVQSWDGASFTSRITSLTSSLPQPMCVFENRNELAVGNGNAVKTYNTSYSLQNTLTLPADFTVVTMRWEENKLFIGTRHKHGGDAKIFTWNGSGSAAQAGYTVRAPRVYSLCNYKSGIVAIVSTGQILRWTGGGFEPLKDAYAVEANFPVWYENRLWQDEDSGTALIGKVLDRGSIADGDLIYINASSAVATNESDTLLKNFPSGIWVFDPQVGLYHKALPTADKIQNVAVSSLASSVLTLASAIQTETGEPIFIEAVGSITGISANQTYYAIKVTTSTFKLALTPADAYAGDNITLAGSAGVATVTVARNRQIGSVNDSEAGAVGLISPQDVTDTFTNSPIVWGSRTYKLGDVDATYDSLNILSQANNMGYFITPKIYASNVLDAWQSLKLRIRNLNLDTDKLIIKYRTRERFGMPSRPSQGTYTSSTVLGGSTNTYKRAAVGDEVVITKGYGAGRSAHITTVNSAELTIDEAIPNVSGTEEVEFYVTDFKKLGTVSNTDRFIQDNYSEHALGIKAPWIQFKVELRGAPGLAIEEVRVDNAQQK